jgi:signal transduction histidine kinase
MASPVTDNSEWDIGESEGVAVLIVDDSEFFADMIAREISERSQFETTACYDGEEALETLERRDDIECIVSDYRMQPLNGLDLLEEVRNTTENLPFILLTGQGSEEIAVKAISSGATDYVTKEMVVEDSEFSLLLNRIERAVSNARAQLELERRKRRLKEQRDSLDILNEVLRHDIRNDIQLILAYIERLEYDLDDEQQLEYLETIQQSADSAIDLTTTAGDIADTLLENGSEVQAVAVTPVIEDEIEALRTTTIEAEVEVDGTLPDVSVHANDMVEAVFRNLLKNAVHHNDNDVPEVTVSATVRDEVLRVEVTDNGPGVPQSVRETLFEAEVSGMESDGTGVGLHLVWTLVTKYGGDIWLEDNDSRGSTFVVELPLAE